MAPWHVRLLLQISEYSVSRKGPAHPSGIRPAIVIVLRGFLDNVEHFGPGKE